MKLEKGTENRLKSLEPVKHIKLLFSIFQNIFNNFPIGLKIDFIDFRMIKKGDQETKVSPYWLKSLELVEYIKVLLSIFQRVFNISLMGLKTLNSLIWVWKLDFMNLGLKKEDDDETKRFSKSLKTLEPFEHIDLLFSIYRKILNKPLMDLRTWFYEFRMTKEYDDEIKRFSQLAEKFTVCWAYQIIINHEFS